MNLFKNKICTFYKLFLIFLVFGQFKKINNSYNYIMHYFINIGKKTKSIGKFSSVSSNSLPSYTQMKINNFRPTLIFFNNNIDYTVRLTYVIIEPKLIIKVLLILLQ